MLKVKLSIKIKHRQVYMSIACLNYFLREDSPLTNKEAYYIA